jgi:hypothetical protein
MILVLTIVLLLLVTDYFLSSVVLCRFDSIPRKGVLVVDPQKVQAPLSSQKQRQRLARQNMAGEFKK